MKIAILHSPDALEPPVDPVLDQVRTALGASDHDAELIVADADVAVFVAALRRAAPEFVFNLTESYAGKSALDSNVAALLNMLGHRYTGSSHAGLLLAGDKALSKKVLQFHGIKTPEFVTMYRGALEWAGDIEFPVIVKPPQEDASIGITAASVVHDLKELFAQLGAFQSEYQSAVLVEQFVEGREFYVGVIGNAHAEALPVIELDFSGFPANKPRIASWEAKWGEDGDGSGAEYAGTKSVFPATLDAALVERMQAGAVEAFHALRLRDYARIDLRVSPSGEIYVIEVNPNCYLERESEFSRAASRAGIEYDALVSRIVDLAMARYDR
jgi:D-alanine-D-alanine ligase